MELGSGCGLCGLVASKHCRSVMLTDREPIALDLCRLNVALSGCKNVSVAKVLWGELEGALEWSAPRFDLVIGSDVLYPSITLHVVRGLLQTARAYLGQRDNAGGQLAKRLLLSFVERDRKVTVRNLCRAASLEGFVIDDVVEESGDVLGSKLIFLSSVGAPLKDEQVARNESFFSGLNDPDPVEEPEVWAEPFAGIDDLL
jgi:hypothetical protein